MTSTDNLHNTVVTRDSGTRRIALKAYSLVEFLILPLLANTPLSMDNKVPYLSSD